MQKRWYTGHELVERWELQTFEIYEFMKKGLQAYTQYGKKIINEKDCIVAVKKRSLKSLERMIREKSVKTPFRSLDSVGFTIVTPTDHDIKQLAKKIFKGQPKFERISPPSNCVAIDFSLTDDEAEASNKISEAIQYRFKAVDVEAFEKQHMNVIEELKKLSSHLMDSNRAENEREKAVESTNNKEMNRVQPEESAAPDFFIKDLQVSYVSDTEIKIKGRGNKAITYGMKELGFKKVNSKTWKEFIGIIKRDDHLYHVGTARGAKGARKTSYDVAQKVLVEINKKLVTFLNKEFQAQLPEGFKVYELIPEKKEAPGTYRFKFKILNHSDADTEEFGKLSEDELLSKIEKLSEHLKKLSNKGDEEAEAQIEKNKNQLLIAVTIACKKDWLTENRATSYLKEQVEDYPHIQYSKKSKGRWTNDINDSSPVEYPLDDEESGQED